MNKQSELETLRRLLIRETCRLVLDEEEGDPAEQEALKARIVALKRERVEAAA